MKQSSALRRYAPLKRGKPPKRGKVPRRVSEKRLRQFEGYPAVRESVIARDGACVLGKLDEYDCMRNSTLAEWYGPLDPHHVNGRRGDRLKDPRGMVALHRRCHDFVHSHQREWRPRLLAYLDRLYADMAAVGA